MKHSSKGIAALVAAGLVSIAGPAFAAGPYTVTAGSQTSGTTSVTGTSGAVAFTAGAVDMTCDSSTVGGTLNLGQDADGVGIANLSTSQFNGCLGPLGIPMNVTQTGPWSLNATGNAAADPIAGSISNVSAHVENPDGACSFDVTGTVLGTFSEASQSLDVSPTGGTLSISNVQGCFGLLFDGDAATFDSTYAVTSGAGAIAIS